MHMLNVKKNCAYMGEIGIEIAGMGGLQISRIIKCIDPNIKYTLLGILSKKFLAKNSVNNTYLALQGWQYQRACEILANHFEWVCQLGEYGDQSTALQLH